MNDASKTADHAADCNCNRCDPPGLTYRAAAGDEAAVDELIERAEAAAE